MLKPDHSSTESTDKLVHDSPPVSNKDTEECASSKSSVSSKSYAESVDCFIENDNPAPTASTSRSTPLCRRKLCLKDNKQSSSKLYDQLKMGELNQGPLVASTKNAAHLGTGHVVYKRRPLHPPNDPQSNWKVFIFGTVVGCTLAAMGVFLSTYSSDLVKISDGVSELLSGLSYEDMMRMPVDVYNWFQTLPKVGWF